MSNLDLAEIRAQLRASQQERPAPRGPLHALKSLIAPAPPSPLLGPPRTYALPAPCTDGGEPPLLLDEPDDGIVLELRRAAFGHRPDQSPALPLEAPPLLLSPTAVFDGPGVGETLRRLRSSLTGPEPAEETPFLPEDLEDPADATADRLYAEAGMPLSPEECPPTPGQALLLALEHRLIDEQMAFIRILAGR